MAKQESEKEKIRNRIWHLNNQIRNAKNGDEIEALIQVRNGLQNKIRNIEIRSLVPVDEDLEGFRCDAETMI